MKKSSNESPEPSDGVFREASGNYDFDLPIEPGYRELPPKGSWEAGYRLSLAALEMIKDRPHIWEERERRRCDVEFVL